MSWEDEWKLTVWPTRGDVLRALDDVIKIARLPPPEITRQLWDADVEADDVEPLTGFGVERDDAVLPPDVTVSLVFRVPVHDAVAMAVRLDPAIDRNELARSVEPPRGDVDFDAAERAGFVTRFEGGRSLAPEAEDRFTTRADHYELAIDLVAPDLDEEEPPRVRIYSNEYDNREAYPVLAHLADAFAVRLEKLGAFS
ncbi:MAG: hypothetical protein JWP01_553 [Myxococcales bacterium]|nr:hypothetical protein [Myxococcales bacterium]